MQNTEPYTGRIVKHLSHQVKELYKFERGKHQNVCHVYCIQRLQQIHTI